MARPRSSQAICGPYHSTSLCPGGHKGYGAQKGTQRLGMWLLVIPPATLIGALLGTGAISLAVLRWLEHTDSLYTFEVEGDDG